MQVVEMEHEDGYRFWSKPMPAEDVPEYIAHFQSLGYSLSDVDESALDDEGFDPYDDDDQRLNDDIGAGHQLGGPGKTGVGHETDSSNKYRFDQGAPAGSSRRHRDFGWLATSPDLMNENATNQPGYARTDE